MSSCLRRPHSFKTGHFSLWKGLQRLHAKCTKMKNARAKNAKLNDCFALLNMQICN